MSAGVHPHPLPVRLRRALAIALLPASILPVFVLGPGIVRAPQQLLGRAVSAIVRIEHAGATRR